MVIHGRDLIVLWFDVETRYKTTVWSFSMMSKPLWFDVEDA